MKVVKASLFQRFAAPFNLIEGLVSTQSHTEVCAINKGHHLEVISALNVVESQLVQRLVFFTRIHPTHNMPKQLAEFEFPPCLTHFKGRSYCNLLRAEKKKLKIFRIIAPGIIRDTLLRSNCFCDRKAAL
jgi:hypothetical protein